MYENNNEDDIYSRIAFIQSGGTPYGDRKLDKVNSVIGSSQGLAGATRRAAGGPIDRIKDLSGLAKLIASFYGGGGG